MSSPSSRPSSPSRAPAGVPSSGNAKYAAVIGALVVGIGALIAWRSCGSGGGEGAARTIPIYDAAPTPHERPEDNVPPPPPEEAASAEITKPKATTASSQDACGSKTCNGTATPELEGALQFRARATHRCYETALAQDNTLRGKMSVTVRIASNGQVCRADVSNSDLPSPQVGQCVASMMRQTGHLPPPKGGCVDISVPMNFVPGGK